MPSLTPARFRLVSAAWLLAAVCCPPLCAGETALDRYIAKPDSSYSWKIVGKTSVPGATIFIVDLKSQTWRTAKDVDRTTWQHWLTIVKPDKPAGNIPFLFITGGSNGEAPPKKVNELIVMTAKNSGGIVCELKMVPNEPLVFKNDGKKRKEDDLIAYTWNEFLNGGDDEWPARLPMTKAAVRAMDAVSSFCAGPEGGGITIDGFVVAGGSKRGWTTWTTAAVDKRVVAIVPIVIDLLNIEPSMLHHYAAYGFWAPSIGDYTALRVMDWTGTPQYRALMHIEEPYEYRNRLTMPKFLINASGDQFFLPDSSQFYFDELPGEKHLRYVPNADHSLKGSDARESLLAFYNAFLYQQSVPALSWKFEKDGTIRVETKDKPSGVKLWQATNPDARDFRLETFGPRWESSSLTAQDSGVYLAKVPAPAKGWTAFFVELTFPSLCQVPFKFSTGVRVLPDTLPYKFVSPGPPK